MSTAIYSAYDSSTFLPEALFRDTGLIACGLKSINTIKH